MFKKLIIAGAVVALVAAAVLVYAFLKPPEVASQVPASMPSQAAAVDVPVDPTATAQPAATAVVEAVTTGDEMAGQGQLLFVVDPARSEARFIIDEILNGSPKTVIGTANQVSGDIMVDVLAPANTRVGTIQVNARTFVTDSEFRNRAIKNRILFTDQYEFITFSPTSISGLPESVNVGQTFTFQIAGDLTIRDISKPVTFEVQVNPISESEITVTAKTEVLRSDYNLEIPQVPSVAGVDNVVYVELDLTAAAAR